MADALVLNKKWTLGAFIAKGGMGEVYAAASDEHPNAAAKLVRKEEGV